MKVLVYDSYEEDFEAAEEVGIELEKIDDHSYVMNLPDDYKMYPEIVSRSSLPNKDDLAYSSGLGFSNLIEYIKSDDDSLSDFVTFGNLIVASAKFSPVEDRESGYDYECKSGVRFFKDTIVSVANFRLSGENDYSGYLEFVDRMIGASIPKVVEKSNNK